MKNPFIMRKCSCKFYPCSVLCALCSLAIASQAHAAGVVYSTSVDWEAITGLRSSEYRVSIKNPKNEQWELYYLDEFPCYGLPDAARIWTGDKNAHVRAVCLGKPTAAKFAWRAANRNDPQGKTTGILECGIENNSIDLSWCEKGKEWKDF